MGRRARVKRDPNRGTRTRTRPVDEAEHDREFFRQRLAEAARLTDEWQGIPYPLPDFLTVLHERHPMREVYEQMDLDNRGVSIDMVTGGPDEQPDDERLVNVWFSRRRNVMVYVWEGNGKRYATVAPRSPDQAMDRLDFWLRTLGASDAWVHAAELKARRKLQTLISDRQWRHYDLTGAFLETSPRSRLTYLFRRLRPTVAMSPRSRWNTKGIPVDDAPMRAIGVLCLHPIGFYDQSWAGCMVPTDDVIAHLTMMRGDEAYYWAKANKHPAWRPEAGL